MSALEWVLVLAFVAPSVAACAAFVLLATWMQLKETQPSDEKHGLA